MADDAIKYFGAHDDTIPPSHSPTILGHSPVSFGCDGHFCGLLLHSIYGRYHQDHCNIQLDDSILHMWKFMGAHPSFSTPNQVDSCEQPIGRDLMDQLLYTPFLRVNFNDDRTILNLIGHRLYRFQVWPSEKAVHANTARRHHNRDWLPYLSAVFSQNLAHWKNNAILVLRSLLLCNHCGKHSLRVINELYVLESGFSQLLFCLLFCTKNVPSHTDNISEQCLLF